MPGTLVLVWTQSYSEKIYNLDREKAEMAVLVWTQTHTEIRKLIVRIETGMVAVSYGKIK